MSDDIDDPRRDEAVAGLPPFVPEEPLASAGTPENVITSGPPSTRRPAAYFAVVLGLLGMVAGAVFFARSLGSTEGGASTPAAAVQKMFDALGDEDALGVLETLLPSERDLFRDSIQTITKELGRLGVLRSDLNLGSLNGIQLEFFDLTFSTATVAPDISTVSLESGRSRYRIDPNGPLGDFVRDLLPKDARAVAQGTDDLSDDDLLFATLKEGDTWYVSIWYSIAEGARKKAGVPAPSFGAGVAAKGAATPEQAVEQFLRAAVALDVRRVIELTPPVEMRALHDYAPLFLPAAEDGVREARDSFSAQIRSLKTSASTSGDRSLVKIDDIAFRAEIPAIGMSIDYDGTCFTVRGEAFGLEDPVRECGKGLTPIAGLPNIAAPDTGFVVVRAGGEWFVSPLGTAFDGLTSMLKVLDRGKLEAFKALFSAFGFEEGFMEVPQPTPSA